MATSLKSNLYAIYIQYKPARIKEYLPYILFLYLQSKMIKVQHTSNTYSIVYTDVITCIIKHVKHFTKTEYLYKNRKICVISLP